MRTRGLALIVALLSAGCGERDVARAPALSEGQGRWAGAADSPVGLVIAPREASPPGARAFGETDWGLAWVDALERFGPMPRRMDPTDLRHQLDGCRALVITRAAQSLIGDSARAAVARWIVEGGSLVLERPDGHWRAWVPVGDTVSAVKAAEVTRVAPAWSALAARGSPPESLPVATVAAPVWSAAPGETLLWLDGRAAAVRLTHGRGRVLALGFDLGRWLVALEQGVPSEDFTVRVDAAGGGDPAILQTDDLALPEAPRRRLVPWADRLQQTVIETALEHAGVARWRLLPDSARGLYIVSHDEEGVGDKWFYFADHEHRAGWPATWFVIPTGKTSPSGYARLVASPLDVGVHPNLRPRGRAFSWRAPWRALRPPPLPDLAAEVLASRDEIRRASEQPLVLSRMHYLEWSPRYADRFLWLAHLGIRLDSTYGPDHVGFGYLFGTGLPFRPLDEEGHAIPIWEMPFQAQDDRAFSAADVCSLFSSGRGGGIGLNFHTTTMGGSHPRAEIMDTYLSAPVWAAAAGFRMMSYGTVLGFWEGRRSALRQEWSGDTLVVRADSTRAAGLVLQLPVRAAGRELTALRAGAAGSWSGAAGARRDGAWLDVPVTRTPFEVQALYASTPPRARR